MTTFNLPDLGEGLQEAEIVSWHVAAGDHVVAEQPLVAVETEKAVVEIPSPRAGHVAQLFAKVGERVKVGAPLLAFAEGPHPETGTVVGTLAEPQGDRPPPRAADRTRQTGPLHTSPAVRARARDLGVDLAEVVPSGPDGSITMDDVFAAAAAPPMHGAGPGDPLRGARRSMALNMARAGREVVPATLHDEADVESWGPQADVTVRLIRAIIAGVQSEPTLNAMFDGATLTLRRSSQIDLGIAIESPDGLFVPVLRNVGNATPQDWRRQIDGAKRGVRDRSLPPAEFRSPTLTLSNFGTLAGGYAALVVMPPQVAIVGAGRIVCRAVPSPNGAAFHRMLPLSLTFDHRAVTGGEAARFLQAMIADLGSAP